MNDWKFGQLQKKYTQNLPRCNFFHSQYDALYFFKTQSMMHFSFLKSNSEALYFFQFKIWLVKKFLIQNHVL